MKLDSSLIILLSSCQLLLTPLLPLLPKPDLLPPPAKVISICHQKRYTSRALTLGSFVIQIFCVFFCPQTFYPQIIYTLTTVLGYVVRVVYHKIFSINLRSTKNFPCTVLVVTSELGTMDQFQLNVFNALSSKEVTSKCFASGFHFIYFLVLDYKVSF